MTLMATPVAMQMAKEYGIDLALVKPAGGRVDKADVLAYLTTLHHPERSPAQVRGAQSKDERSGAQLDDVQAVVVSPPRRKLVGWHQNAELI